MKPFVCVELFGGLGNQIFQYAAGKAVARYNNCELLVNKERDNKHNVNGHNYARELFTDAVEVDFPTNDAWLFQQQGVHMYKQSNGFEAWNPKDIPVPCILSGYFQYLPAIEFVLPEVRAILMKNLHEYPYQRNDLAFLHVRRGDYLKLPDFHYIQTEEYYTKALQLLFQKNPEIRELYVFSDDLQWCKQQAWLHHIPFVKFIENTDEIRSLSLMSLCIGGAVIGNSTYSWWGAMLSRSKHVIYPSRWIAQKIENLFPSHWVKA